MKYDIDDESLARWKDVFAKDDIKYETDDEYREAIRNFTGFIDTLIEIDRSQKNTNTSEESTDELYLLDEDGNKIIL